MKNRIVMASLVVTLMLLLAGCASTAPQGSQITVEEPWARAAAAMEMDDGDGMQGASGDMQAQGGTSAAYMILRNAGREADRLVEVQTDVAAVVETHLSEERDGVMVMSRVDGIEVPAQGQTELRPGGLHIMLINLTQDLNPGDTINLTLVFENAGSIQISVPVREP